MYRHEKDAMRALDEPLLREVNRRIHALTRSFDGPSEFLCECGHATCRATMLVLDPAEFADILAVPGRRLVAPGHETPGTAILRQGAGYLVVHEPDPERAPLPLRAP